MLLATAMSAKSFLLALMPGVLFGVLSSLGATSQSPAQTPAPPAADAAHTMRCHVRTLPLSPGEKALGSGDLPRAESLFTEEAHGAGLEADRSHNNLIRVLLLEEKFDIARKNAAEWFAAEPKNSWAEVSVGEVQWRMGEISEAMYTIDEAGRLDPCNARVDADAAVVFDFMSLGGSAKTRLEKAHRLAPIDETIGAHWIDFQPRSVRLESLSNYLTTADFLTPEQRKSLERQKEELSAPPPVDRCHIAGSVQSTSIPYLAMQDGPYARTYWGLTVSFNGKGRRLEIDTGAHGLVLTRSAANALHLVVEERGKAWGIGDEGAVASHISRVKSIKIGTLEFADCAVEILDTNPAGMQSQDGLIGGDVFSDFILTLDFPGRMLKLDPLPPLPHTAVAENTPSLNTGTGSEEQPVHDRYIDPSMAGWTHVFRSGHDLILPVNINNSSPRLFIVDTGSSLNLIDQAMAKQVVKVTKGSDVELRGISGRVNQTYSTGPVTLTFAKMQQPSTGMIGMDTSNLGRSAGVNIAGLIGAPTLHQLTLRIDYRDNLMQFSYDPKRITHCVDGIHIADCY